jgi:hypothetical protein
MRRLLLPVLLLLALVPAPASADAGSSTPSSAQCVYQPVQHLPPSPVGGLAGALYEVAANAEYGALNAVNDAKYDACVLTVQAVNGACGIAIGRDCL